MHSILVVGIASNAPSGYVGRTLRRMGVVRSHHQLRGYDSALCLHVAIAIQTAIVWGHLLVREDYIDDVAIMEDYQP